MVTNPAALSANELRAVAYFAVGVTSEGSVAGRDVSYRLSFAGNVGAGRRMEPVANSGYSIGTLQIDLGQHPGIARELLDNYQVWARVQPDRNVLVLDPRQFDETLASLQRTGRQMRAIGAVDIDRSRIDRFLASGDGQQFVHALDSAHVARVAAADDTDTVMDRLQRTRLYRYTASSEQVRLAGMFMKLQNQAGTARWPGVMDQVEAGKAASAVEVKDAIDGLLRDQPNGQPDYLQSGADNTLRGVAVLNALRDADARNPLARAWADVLADPLVGPVAARADAARPVLAFEYDTIRSLFLTPEASCRFIAALDTGGSLAEGDPRSRAGGSRQAGFHASGDDFVHWNRDGQGWAYVSGRWRAVATDSLTRVRNADGTTEIRLEENGQQVTLLRVDPNARAERAVATAPESVHRRGLDEYEHAIAESLRRSIGAWYGEERILAMMGRVHDAVPHARDAIDARNAMDGAVVPSAGDHLPHGAR